MLNKLSQIIVVILSILLAFYCVDVHANTILTSLNIDENSKVVKKEKKMKIVKEKETPKSIHQGDEHHNLENKNIEKEITKQEVVMIQEKIEINTTKKKKNPENTKQKDEFSSLELMMREELKKEIGK